MWPHWPARFDRPLQPDDETCSPMSRDPMNVQSIRRSIVELETHWLALGVFDDASEPPASVKGVPLGDQVARLMTAKELPGGPGETLALYGPSAGASDGVLLF